VTLPVTEARPVPGFPFRKTALLLATGKSGAGYAITGAGFERHGAIPRPWSLPLSARPVLTACAFQNDGPVTVAYLSEEPGTSRLTRLAVDDSGRRIGAEEVVYSTPNRIVALAAYVWRGAPPLVLALEEPVETPDHLRLVAIPVAGNVAMRELGAVAGWPVFEGRAAAPSELALAVRNGVPALAFLDGHGGYWAAALDGSPLRRLNGSNGPRLLRPHIVALPGGLTFSAFIESGVLAHFGGF
jgi:hypothetical protein